MKHLTNIRKSLLIPFYLCLVMGVISCQEQEEILPESIENQEQVFADDEFYYTYKGQNYDSATWVTDFSQVSDQAYMVVVDNAVHVFDEEEEATVFADEIASAPKTESTGTGGFSVRLYEHTQFRGSWIQYNASLTINRDDIWGTLTGNEYKVSLPSAWRKRISSYKIFNITHASVYKYKIIGGKKVYYDPVNLSLYFRCYTGANFDGPWSELTLYNAPGVRVDTYFEDNDLTNDRIPRAFWLVSWNDNIQSFKFTFR